MNIRFFISVSIVISSVISCSGSSDSDDSGVKNPIPTPSPTTGITTANVRSYMVDPAATTETVALFYNLKKNVESQILLGHQDAFYQYYKNDNSASDVKKTTGSDPALIGLDLMFITDKSNEDISWNWFYQQQQKITAAAKEAFDKGLAVTFAWHLREPYKEDHFYTSEMTNEQKTKAFKSILPGGENHEWFKKKLDKVALIFTGLVGTNGQKIPVIFRPFHEFDGDWFWWGAKYCTADEYKQVFQFTVKYLKETKNVHNVLFAFSPDASFKSSNQYLERYPGDEYVDILGMDNYQDFANQSSAGVSTANSKLKIISDLAKTKNKISALTETGYVSSNSVARSATHFTTLVYPAITNNNIEIAYICFWANSEKEYFVPTPGTSYENDFKNFSMMSKMKLQTGLTKSLYKLP